MRRGRTESIDHSSWLADGDQRHEPEFDRFALPRIASTGNNFAALNQPGGGEVISDWLSNIITVRFFVDLLGLYG
jgi:hypothetical protein